MSNIKLSGFAEACYNTNSAAELMAALVREADKTDCAAWGITEVQWKDAIYDALLVKANDYFESEIEPLWSTKFDFTDAEQAHLDAAFAVHGPMAAALRAYLASPQRNLINSLQAD